INITTRMRSDFYAHIQRLPATWHDRATVGTVMSLATNDMDACRFFWNMGMLLFFDTLYYFAITPVVMGSLSLELTLICLIPLPLIPVIVIVLSKKIEDRFESVQEQFSTLSEQAHESFAGSKVVKSFAIEDRQVEQYAKLSREHQKRSMKLALVQTLQNPALLLLLGLCDFIVVIYGGFLVLNGEMLKAEFVPFFFALMRLTHPMIALGMVIAIFQRGNVSRRRIEEVMSIAPAIVDAPDATVVERPRGEVEFKHLTFAYMPDSPPALTDVSLRVPAGSMVALAGEVGSGKTTLLNLVARLYDPPAGTVFIDGVDIRKLKMEWLRRNVAVVPQETFLFSETISENIAYGLSHITPDPDKLKYYARVANVESDILELSSGYDTMLGERGVNLSGGQKQRISIARALACEAPILILDDCLSAVDTQTEEAILYALKKEARGRTTFIVSHRVSTLRNADTIIVLERGKIIERGSHDELLASGGWYATLDKLQQLEAGTA
ncbi:MAG: ABC transporter ATP-binding protein/permease, partial [Planctomycetes bacterium]|nr:ABC transporter ATP-binding protein/permease [Planctomycetota bacterium]